MKLMLVTEQPAIIIKQKNPLLKDINGCPGKNKCYGETLTDYSHAFVDTYGYLEPTPRSFPVDYYCQERDDSIIPRIKNTIAFLKETSEIDISIYWTHYIKCMGKPNFKDVKEVLKEKMNINECANQWIKKETDLYKPDIIITFGSYAAGYMIFGEGKSSFKELGIRVCESYESEIGYGKISVLPHPSRLSTMANDYWDGDIPSKALKDFLEQIITNI